MSKPKPVIIGADMLVLLLAEALDEVTNALNEYNDFSEQMRVLCEELVAKAKAQTDPLIAMAYTETAETIVRIARETFARDGQWEDDES